MNLKQKLDEMISSVPDKDQPIGDVEALRFALIAELDAISLYEKLAGHVSSDWVKKVLLDVAREEKTHVHEFEYLISELDSEWTEEKEEAYEELKEMGIR